MTVITSWVENDGMPPDPRAATNGAPARPGVFPRFYLDKVQTLDPSGRTIWVDRERVEILIAGDVKSRAVHNVTDAIRAQYPQHYAAFKAGLELSHQGTPLEVWGRLSPAIVENLRRLNVHTVEALAEIPDSALIEVGMGGRALRDRAIAFVAVADDAAKVDFYAIQMADLRDDNKRKDQTIAELKERLSMLEARLGGDSQPQQPEGDKRMSRQHRQMKTEDV